MYKFSLWRIVLIFNKDPYQKNVKKYVHSIMGLGHNKIRNTGTCISLTKVLTALGLCILTALVAWNTSTIVSALNCSIALLTAQNTPERPTVSL